MRTDAIVAGLLALLPTLASGCKTSDNGRSDERQEGAAAPKSKVAADQSDPKSEAAAQRADRGEMRTKQFPDPDLSAERYEGDPQAVTTFHGAMPTGVSVTSDGRTFVNFPRWGDEPRATVTEIVDGKPTPYPNSEINERDESSPESHFLSVQSVVVGPEGDRLWVLDTGRPEFQPTVEGGAKLVAVDLEADEVVETFVIPGDVALETSYLNDVRFDYDRGESGMAYITDSSGAGDNGIVVIDLESGECWRRLHRHPATQAEPNFVPVVEGRPLWRRPADGQRQPMTVGSDGIALGADGQRLYFRPLSGRGLFSVSLDALSDPDVSEEDVVDTLQEHGDLGFASDGLAAAPDGGLYLTNYEDNAVMRWTPDGELETVVHHPQALWPDTLSVADGWLYFTANQLHRQPAFNGGEDVREKPYVLFRVEVEP